MTNLVSEFLLKEDINIFENKNVEKAIVFSDIVKSASKWLNNPDEMIQVIEDLTDDIDSSLEKYDGLIIKSIGDAFMFAFNELDAAIRFSIELQEHLKENPYEIEGSTLDLRIGICYGNVYEATTTIQNQNMKDYLGNTVNTASRIESKVCEEGDVAFSFIGKTELNLTTVEDIFDKYDVEMISFTNEENEIHRSGRLINNIQRHTYKDTDELKGIGEIDVFKINI